MIKQISSLNQAQVVVIGDLMLDRYWHGQTQRISPEAPVPVVHVDDEHGRPGGAGNVALNLRAVGARTALVGCVGDDAAGRELVQLLENAQIEACIERLAKCSTTVKLRVLSHDQQLIRLDFEQTLPKDSNILSTVRWQSAVAKCNALVLSDYAKGVLHDPKPYISYAREHQIPVLVDPKGDDFSRYQGATLLTPNSQEFARVAGAWSDRDDLVHKARKLIETLDLQAILVTLGKDGMCLIQRDSEVYHLKAHTQEIYDVTGAGDTVIAVLAAGLGTGLSMRDSAQLANLAAGIAVRRLGAAQVTVADLRRAWYQLHQRSDAILTPEELSVMVEDARSRGENIVLTNGCFDILHAGHVNYLNEAKALGHRLIVAVNDDDSVRRLKGHGRPINSVEKRQSVLAALSCVDWVVDFAEDTPEKLIAAIKPDLLVKGGDYQSVNDVVGAAQVWAYGGDVKVLSLTEGASTTQVLRDVHKHHAVAELTD